MGDVAILIYDVNDPIYLSSGINFSVLSHLDDIGFVSFETLTGFKRMGFPKRILVSYYRQPTIIEFEKDTGNELETGKVLLTQVGQQMAPICGSEPVPQFLEYVLDRWSKKGLGLSSPYPRKPV